MKPELMFLFLLWLGVASGQRALFRCINLYSKERCYALFHPLQGSLLSNERNHFELAQGFFPMGVFASTSLVNVLYTVQFMASNESSLPSACPENIFTNNSAVVPNDSARFSVGWTNAGVFNILTAFQLSELQLQILNELYSFFIVPGGGIFFPGSFGWKVDNVSGGPVEISERNTVELSLALDLSELACIPNTNLIIAVLQDITVFLKVYASDFGSQPPIINQDDLGFVTAAGVDVEDAVHLYITPFFPTLFLTLNVLLGACALLASSFSFVKAYKLFSYGRRQFGYYFTALSFVAFSVNLTILIADAIKSQQWCNATHFNGTNHHHNPGCDQIVITKLSYQWSAVLCSLVAALVVFKLFGNLEMNFQASGFFRKIRYIAGFWMIILMLGLCTWGIVPSIMLCLVYPTFVISLSALVFALLFWTTVMISIPLLFTHNFLKSPDWWAAYQCITRLGSLAIAFLVAGLVKILYITATAFGTTTGMILFIAIGIVPSLLLAIYSEHYRDWFLTRVLGNEGNSGGDGESIKQKTGEHNDENTTTLNVQEGGQEHHTDEESHQTINLQVITTDAGVKECSRKPEENVTSQDTVVDKIFGEDNTDLNKVMLGARNVGASLRRATVSALAFTKGRGNSDTYESLKPRREGFRRTNEPRHALLRGLTKAYHQQ